MATVIDELIITLGLDPTRFTKGQKEAAAALQRARDDTKKAGEDMSSSLTKVAEKITALFLSFEAAKKLANWLGDLNQAEADLGRFAKNLGLSAHEVNLWGRAIELSGGNAKDAQVALGALSQDLTKLLSTGEASPLLYLLQNLHVPLYDAQHQLRKVTDIYTDLAAKVSDMDQRKRHDLLAQAGLSGGMLNFLAEDAKLRREQFVEAEKNNKVTDASVAKAQELQAKWREIGQEIDGLGQRILEKITAPTEQAVKAAGKFIDTLSNSKAVNGAFEAGVDALSTLVNLLTLAERGIERVKKALGDDGGKPHSKWWDLLPPVLAHDIWSWARGQSDEAVTKTDPDQPGATNSVRGTIARGGTSGASASDPRGIRNNNPGNLKLIGGEHDAEGFSKFPSVEEGMRQLNEQLDRYAGRGLNTIRKIVEQYEGKEGPGNHNDIPAYIRSLERATGRKADDVLSGADRARLTAGIVGVEVGFNAAVARGLVPTPTSAPGSGGSSSSTSSVTHIGKIEVNTQATDPQGVAQAVHGVIIRHGNVSQADSGQVP